MNRTHRALAAAAGISGLIAFSGFRQQPVFEVPAWAFPSLPSEVRSTVRASDTALRTLPHSRRSFTAKEISDRLNPPDWTPDDHPPAPAVVVHARPEMKYACGLCHLPDGQGRSENATVAGLPEAYTRAQIADIRSGARASALDFASSTTMKAVALAATDAEIEEAANYFAGLHPRKQYTVKESTMVPRSYQAGGLYALRAEGGTEELGDRMMEISDNIEHHELRDPNETFTVYVRPGTLAIGRKLAIAAPPESPTRCATCHGSDLRGGSGDAGGPPIAGKSPLYLIRQLAAFRTKTRNGSSSGPMQVVTSMLSLREMVAAAAYAGSRAP